MDTKDSNKENTVSIAPKIGSILTEKQVDINYPLLKYNSIKLTETSTGKYRVDLK